MPASIVLLPQSPQGLLQSLSDRVRILMLKKLLIDETIATLEDFFLHQYMHNFDGHVGETLCQIRGYQLYWLKLNLENDGNRFILAKKIHSLQQLSHKLAVLIQQYQLNIHRREEPQTVSDFLQVHNAIYEVSPLEVYLIQLHLLSRFKAFDADGNISIDYKKMCTSLNISKHMARKIIHIYQVEASQYSINFIYSLIVKRFNKSSLINIFNDLKKIDDDGRSTLPCYWVMELMYESMRSQNYPILVVCERRINNQYMDTVFLVFKPSSFAVNEYEYCPLSNGNLNNLHFIVKGIANYNGSSVIPSKEQYIKSFKEEGIRKIIFANMAIHPQYTGKKLSLYKDNPYLDLLKEKINQDSMFGKQIKLLADLHQSQQKMKMYAEQLGCGKQNPSFLYIRHIFCDTLNNQLQLSKLNEYEDAQETSFFAKAVG